MSNIQQIHFDRRVSLSDLLAESGFPQKYPVRSPQTGAITVREGIGDDRSSATLRGLAIECVTLAERTIDPDSRIALLIIAQKWISIANNRVVVDTPSKTPE
jgi:hypothetical protein